MPKKPVAKFLIRRGKVVRIYDALLLRDSKTFYNYIDQAVLSNDLALWYGRWVFSRELLYIHKKLLKSKDLAHCRLVSYYSYMKGKRHHV